MARYLDAVRWIAVNDEDGSGHSVEEIAGYLTVALVADVWTKDVEVVAEDVAGMRSAFGLPVRWAKP